MQRLISIVFCMMFQITAFAASGHAAAVDTDLVATQGPNGETLADLSIHWWQWVTTAPDGSDPLADETGEMCSYGQKGDVFFLATSYSTKKISRSCTVPAGKYLFVPIINMMMWDEDDGLSCEELHDDVKAAINTARDLGMEVDGKKIPGIEKSRVVPKSCFAIPDDNDRNASDGYWVLLKPLAAGQHVIHVKGRLGDNGATAEDFNQDIEYTITVK